MRLGTERHSPRTFEDGDGGDAARDLVVISQQGANAISAAMSRLIFLQVLILGDFKSLFLQLLISRDLVKRFSQVLNPRDLNFSGHPKRRRLPPHSKLVHLET